MMDEEDLLDKIESLEDELAEGCALREIECIRCHKVFTSLKDVRHCSRDCQMGFTPAPSYEDWYRTMHPDSPWLKHA